MRWKISASIFAAAALTLSVAHHALGFWELEIAQEVGLAALAIPLATFLIFLFLDRVWDFLWVIEKKRGLFILFPAFIAAFLFANMYYRAPSVWHTLKIIPQAGTGAIELREVKYPPAKILKLSQTQNLQGWTLENGFLKTTSADFAPLEYSFRAPIGQPARLLFLCSPTSGSAAVALDGQIRQVELKGSTNDFESVEILTAYKMGIPAAPILALIALADFFSCFFLIGALWLIQEIAQSDGSALPVDAFPAHRINLAILFALAFIFHALNFLSVPLVVASDSASYLQGVFHWLQYGNLDGVSAARGPGTTLLFMPAFLLFGNHPWGVKLTLHFFAIGTVLLSYALAWKIYQRRAPAFFSALITLFIPELYLYSNIVMSDAPNVFFMLAYCVALLAALQNPAWKNLLAHALLGAWMVLFRAENILLLALGFGFLFLNLFSLSIKDKNFSTFFFKRLALTLTLSLLPLFGWSAHNLRVYGFFGLSNYADEVLYDGWVYYGEASKIHITDEHSAAVQKIQQALDAYNQPLGETDVPTGWEIYPALLARGYDENEAIHLLGEAARDSILKDPALSFRLYLVKLKKSFIPPHSGVLEKTFNLNEPYRDSTYFQSEQTFFTAFIPAQQAVYRFFSIFDQYLYRPLVFFALAAAVFAFYQKRSFVWTPLAAIALSRMFIPVAIGVAHWHYMLAGIVVLFALIPLPIQMAGRAWNATRHKRVTPSSAKYD